MENGKSMIQAPFNNLIVKVDTKYIRHISNILKMSSIQKESTLNPADTVQIIGDIISVPKQISEGKQYEGFSLKDIRPGDKAIFSHMVIFSFNERGANEDPQYKNRFFYKAEEYFVCNIQYLYGVIRDGEIIMVNGYSMIYDFEDQKIILSSSTKKKVSITSSEIMHIGNPRTDQPALSEISPEDSVLFNKSKVIRYQIASKKFCILPQTHILGKIMGLDSNHKNLSTK